jgi:hypothetical protein
MPLHSCVRLPITVVRTGTKSSRESLISTLILTSVRVARDNGMPKARSLIRGWATGAFFCGPKGLGSTLHKMCNKYSGTKEDSVRFYWNKVCFHWIYVPF